MNQCRGRWELKSPVESLLLEKKKGLLDDNHPKKLKPILRVQVRENKNLTEGSRTSLKGEDSKDI